MFDKTRFQCIAGALVLLLSVSISIDAPIYVWPLGNTSFAAEVMKENNATFAANKECFLYDVGPSGFPYSAMVLDGLSSAFDMTLLREDLLQDFTFALYVYPYEIFNGTLFHYTYQGADILKIWTEEGAIKVTVRNKDGLDLGTASAEAFFIPFVWNKIAILRDHSNGRLQLYHGDSMIISVDDGFPDNFMLPPQGLLRLGGSSSDDSDYFKGRLSCFQVYDYWIDVEDMASNMPAFCQPDKWNIQPHVSWSAPAYLPATMCLHGKTPAADIGIITLADVTSETRWQRLRTSCNWRDSGFQSSYFRLNSVGLKHNADTDSLGDVLTTGLKVCARVCMRILSCVHFVTHNRNGDVVNCTLYDHNPGNEMADDTARQYMISN